MRTETQPRLRLMTPEEQAEHLAWWENHMAKFRQRQRAKQKRQGQLFFKRTLESGCVLYEMTPRHTRKEERERAEA